MKQATPRRAREGAEKLAKARLPTAVLLDEVSELFSRVLPYDCGSVHTVDPMTVTMSSCRPLDGPPDGHRVARYEYLVNDVNSLAALGSGRRNTGLLSAATGGRRERSPRYRELLRPAGIADELRAAFVVDGRVWGSFAWYRIGPGGFSADEVDLVDELGPVLGRAFRAAAARASGTGPTDGWAPGVILVDRGGRMRGVTGTGRRWLTEVGFGGEPLDDVVPHALRSVTERARACEGDATVRVIGASGSWVEVHASAVPDGEPGQVAIILQSPTPGTIAPLIASAYGLSGREREVTALVLRGLSTAAIAARLFISPNTVQDHLKSIFGKVGVRSRRELVGRMAPPHTA